MISPSIHDFVKQQEADFEASEVQIGDNWYWNFRRHVQMIFHLMHGIFFTGENDFLRSFKQVMKPLLTMSHWTEDLEVKDVIFYIESAKGRVLSFFLKKYHDEVYSHKNNLDTLFDEITENDIDYGGVLVQKTPTVRPEVLPLMQIAFCDQTDIMGGPMAFKHYFSPDKLRSMKSLGWGEEKNGANISLDDLATLASCEKEVFGQTSNKSNRVPGRVVEIYIIRGNLPEAYLKDNDNFDDWYNQVQVIGFYTNEDKKQERVILYRKKEVEGNLKFYSSKMIPGRALGESDGEALIHPQIWTNCLEIWKHQMLEAGSKVPLVTDDPNYTNANKIQEMENLEITTIDVGRTIRQVPTAAPNNIQLFVNSVNEWYNNAQLNVSGFDPMLGKEPNSGTTFRGQERVVAQGRGPHDRRRGQRAKFIEEIYRDWIIPQMVREITGGVKFLASLTSDELAWVADELATIEADNRLNEAILDGKTPSEEDRALIKETLKGYLLKKGNRQLIEVLKGAFDGIEIKVGINVAGKQKDLAVMSDKILSIFQFIFSNPDAFQQAIQRFPALAKSFNNILEYSGIQQADFSTFLTAPAAPQASMNPQLAAMSPDSQMMPANQPQQ